MDNEPLFKGGCGHSAKEIEDTATACGWVLTAFITLCLMLFVASFF
jgi:hypothetical protein